LSNSNLNVDLGHNEIQPDNSDEHVVSYHPDGTALSCTRDDTWTFHTRVLDRYVKRDTDVSTIPFWIREFIYSSYCAEGAEHDDIKQSTLLGEIQCVRNLLKHIDNKELNHLFTQRGLSTYLSKVHGKYAYGTLSKILSVYWRLSVAAHESGQGDFPRYAIDKLCLKHCDPSLSEAKQTLAMPMAIASEIMGNALSLFYASKESLPEITALISEYGAVKNQSIEILRKKSPNQKEWHSNAHTSVKFMDITTKHLSDSALATYIDGNYNPRNISKLLNSSLVACYHLLMSFTGMRLHELYRIHDDSFERYEDDGQTYCTVTAETSKLEKGGDRVDKWVCSELCEDILKYISAVKKVVGITSKSIVIVFQNVHKANVKNEIGFSARYIDVLTNNVCLDDDSYNEYCKLNRERADELSTGDQWPLSPHQWRRTFATLALRFDLATLQAIKRQFKHVSLQMTEWYANYARITRNEETRIDSELNALIHEIQSEMATDVLYDAYNTDKPLAGGKGTAIEAARLSESTPKVFSSHASIKSLIRNGEVNLNYAGLNYCMNSYRCDQEGVVNAAFCTGCESSLIPEDMALKWQKLHARCVSHIEFAMDCGDMSPVSYAHFVSQIRAAERVMKKFNLEFNEYQDAS
jgi:hypothetical protein